MQVLAQNLKKRDLKMNFFDEIRKKDIWKFLAQSVSKKIDLVRNFLDEIQKENIWKILAQSVPKKREIWKGISWIRLGADWIGWYWRDRRRFLFEAKLMTRWFKKLSHLHLILILSSKEMKRYYRHILMFYTMPDWVIFIWYWYWVWRRWKDTTGIL